MPKLLPVIHQSGLLSSPYWYKTNCAANLGICPVAGTSASAAVMLLPICAYYVHWNG